MAKYKLSEKYPQKRAFITGAASGLGKALCLELAQDGWILGICDINYQKLAETATEIQKNGASVFAYDLDVADKAQYAEVVQDFLSHTQGIDILFNNAGVGDGGLVGEYSLDNWAWIIGINQMSVIYGCHYFVPVMKAQKSGHIINTASIASIAAMPKMAAYNTSKAAVLALSETLHSELKIDNIKVSCVMPYFFKTNIAQYARGGEEVKLGAQKLIDESKFSASDIAKQVLVSAGKEKLHIVLIKEAKFIWNLKRWFPKLFFKMIQKRYLEEQKEVEQMQAELHKMSTHK